MKVYQRWGLALMLFMGNAGLYLMISNSQAFIVTLAKLLCVVAFMMGMYFLCVYEDGESELTIHYTPEEPK